MSVTAQAQPIQITNFFGGTWNRASSRESLDVINPATSQILAEVPLSTERDVADVIESAAAAYPAWRRTLPEVRIQYLFKLKQLLEDNIEELARTITLATGKTLSEACDEICTRI